MGELVRVGVAPLYLYTSKTVQNLIYRLAWIVQNYGVPIKTRISWVSVRWPDGYTNLDWRESYEKAHARWLAEYTLWVDPDRLDENRYYRCPHGTLVASDTNSGAEANFCTVCHPLSVSTPPRLKPYGMPLKHPLRVGLPTFPRKGVFYLTGRGTIGRHYYPGDHEICPYEPRWRMRTPEAPGGYRRSGQKDGVAILAFPKRATYDDEFEGDEQEGEPEGPPGNFATMLCPWEFNRPGAVLFRRRWFNSYAVPVLADNTSLLEFAEIGRLARWSDLTERPRPEIELTPSGRMRHKDKTPPLPTDSQKLAEHFSRLKAEAEKALEFYRRPRPRILYLFSVPPMEGDTERWRKKYWLKRKPYVCHARKPWPENWRTERKMRDLDARLDLYQWGSHNEIRNVPQMMQTTAKRAHEAWIEERWHSGPAWPQQPARHKTERRYLYPAPGPSLPNPYRKPSPWVDVYSRCVLPSCCPNYASEGTGRVG
jgi:hypothetical protein